MAKSPRGWSNVKNVFLAPFRGQSLSFGRNQTYVPVASQAASAVTGAAVVGGAAYAIAKAAAAGALATSAALRRGASSAVTSTAGRSATTNLLNKAGLVGAGVVGGSLLRRDNQKLSQAQTAQPEQEVNPTQKSTSDIKQDAFTDLGVTSAYAQAGRDIFLRQDKSSYSSQDVYNYMTPSQVATPTQSTYTGQEGGQSSGMDLTTIALIGAGLYFLTK